MNAANDAPPRVTGKLEGTERMPRRHGCCQLHLEDGCVASPSRGI